MSESKQRAAEKALEWVQEGMTVGVGTGSTVAFFVDALARSTARIAAVVSSSERTTAALRAHGIVVRPLDQVDRLALYVDGADECDPRGRLIKGGGGALTREKILAEAADTFVCIVDPSKRVDVLGAFPLPIEVIPMARGQIARTLEALTGGRAMLREGFTTDNGNCILDLHGLHIVDPGELEARLEPIPGVVTVGLFARRKADVIVTGTDPVSVERSPFDAHAVVSEG